ncbi:MAG: biopolymer transport protein TolR [Rickettsiales bacterium]|jgi:biopolymer transport protein TolR
MAFNIGGKNSRKRRAAMSDINITPFVDVLLVLLIIFMVAAPMMTGSIELELPKGVSKANQVKDEPIAVSIKSDGTIFLQEEKVKLRFLPVKLMDLTNKNIDSKIFVRADSKIDYGRVMEAVKSINSAGFTQVVLVTEIDG